MRTCKRILQISALLILQLSQKIKLVGCGPRTDETPPNFPTSIQLVFKDFENWSTNVQVQSVPTAIPKTPEEIVILVNWAKDHGWRIRPSGYAHSFAPITITSDPGSGKYLLVDMTHHLTQMKLVSESPNNGEAYIWTQSGATIESILTYLEDHGGYGWLAATAPGQLSIGGVLAIGGHGAGVPALGENLQTGQTYGTLSNRILSFTAVVWDPVEDAYVLRTFNRGDLDSKAFLTHLGRALITDVTLLAGKNLNLRCVSRVDIPIAEIFGPSSSPMPKQVHKSFRRMAQPRPRTLSSLLDSHGRVEVIWFPFTSRAWLKLWSVAPVKPPISREVKGPYNYIFTTSFPIGVIEFGTQFITENPAFTPTFLKLQFKGMVAGLLATDTTDLWGPSKNVLLYVKPDTVRQLYAGSGILTTRNNVQKIVSTFFPFFLNLIKTFARDNKFPMNGPMDVRVIGADEPSDTGLVGPVGAQSPSLSGASPILTQNGTLKLDTVVWLNFMTLPGTSHFPDLMTQVESFLMKNFNDGVTMILRPEWVKGWGYTSDGPWTNITYKREFIPKAFSYGGQGQGDWAWTKSVFEKYDPHHVFTNLFLDDLFNL